MVEHEAGGLRAQFAGEGQRVGLEAERAVPGGDLVAVDRPLGQLRDEQLPDAGAAERAHRVQAPVPGVEIADEVDARGVRRPDGEGDARDAVHDPQVRAEDLPELLVRPLADQVQVQVAEGREEAVGVAALELAAVGEAKAQPVGRGVRVPLEQGREEPALVQAAHRDGDRVGQQRLGAGGVGLEGAQHPGPGAPRHGVDAEDAVRVVQAPGEQLPQFLARGGRAGRVSERAAGSCHRLPRRGSGPRLPRRDRCRTRRRSRRGGSPRRRAGARPRRRDPPRRPPRRS